MIPCYYMYMLHSYASVYLLSPHLASPYGFLSKITRKNKMIPQLLSPYHFSLLKNAFKWNTMASSQWLNIAHTFSVMVSPQDIRDNVPYLQEGGTITCLLGRGKRKKQEFNLLLKPSESCQQERLLFVWFLSETADPLGPRKAHTDLLRKKACLLVCFFLWCTHSGKIDPQHTHLLLFHLGEKKNIFQGEKNGQ